MAVLNTAITKQPLKLIEVPLNKFSEEVIPHHQMLFEQHKATVLKLISHKNQKLVQEETKRKKRVVKQLKDLMYELDTLRAQVEDNDLDKFDTKTLSFRKIIINLISGYTDLEKKGALLITREEEKLATQCPFDGLSQIQLHENIDEVKLRQQQELLHQVETVQQETHDLNEMYVQLNQMVDTQKEQVEQVDENVESTHENVHSGLKNLVKASRLKTAAYPVTGAFIGSMIGGPVGLVAGFKIGGLTALGCAIAGYTGGKLFKKNNENVEVIETNQAVDGCEANVVDDKKDI